MSYENFRKEILKVHDKRHHIADHSFGVKHAYDWIRKNKWLGHIEYRVPLEVFRKIIRQTNLLLIDKFIEGNDINLPYELGKLELKKYKTKVTVEDGKIKTNFSNNWEGTLKLWYEDKESKEKKTLLKFPDKEVFFIKYNKLNRRFNNKSFYKFRPNREFKKRLREKINSKSVEAFI